MTLRGGDCALAVLTDRLEVAADVQGGLGPRWAAATKRGHFSSGDDMACQRPRGRIGSGHVAAVNNVLISLTASAGHLGPHLPCTNLADMSAAVKSANSWAHRSMGTCRKTTR